MQNVASKFQEAAGSLDGDSSLKCSYNHPSLFVGKSRQVALGQCFIPAWFFFFLSTPIFFCSELKKKKKSCCNYVYVTTCWGMVFIQYHYGEKPAASQGMGRRERGSVTTSLSSQLLMCGLLSHDCPGRKNLWEWGAGGGGGGGDLRS